MFVKAIKIAKSAMFPIFHWEQVSSSQARVTVVGAGFFINSAGYFVSVTHIFDNPNIDTKFLYMGRLPDEVQNPSLELKEITRNDEYDIFVGNIKIKSPKYFYLEKKVPDIGKSVCISGYPLAQITNNTQGGLELGGVRRYFQPSFVLDRAIVDIDNGAGCIRKHDGFLVRDFGLFGMSGGPVLNTKGLVVGIQGSVTPPRKSSGPGGRSISVENAVVIRSNLMLDLLKKNNIRVNFWGKF